MPRQGSLTAAATNVSRSLADERPIVGVRISGTWVATLQFEASLDGANWSSVSGHPLSAGTAQIGRGTYTTSTNGTWLFELGGFTHFRVRCSAYTSGTIVVDINPTTGPPYKGAGPVFGALPENSTSTALQASRVVLAEPGVLYGVSMYNDSAGPRWLHVFDAAALPANGAVPAVAPIPVATQDFRSAEWTQGRRFSTGIVVASSSTDTTLTVSGADAHFDAQFGS